MHSRVVDMSGEQGIITIATGKAYRAMAYDLGLSLKLHAGQISRAIVTDVPEQRLVEVYDSIITVRPELGDGYRQKLNLDQYTPYDRTMFIDADCLVVRDLADLFARCADRQFAFAGEIRREGKWYDADLQEVCQRLGLPDGLAVLNTGFFCFVKGPLTDRLFHRARELHDQQVDGLGFGDFRGTRSDEPALAIALTEARQDPLEESCGESMRTPIGIDGPMYIDVLRGDCTFRKYQQLVRPAIVHFATWQYHPLYYRERAKLRAHFVSPMMRQMAWLIGQAVYVRETASRVLQNRLLRMRSHA